MKEYFDDIQEVPNVERYIDSILFKNFLNKKLEDKKELKLSNEIIKKKYEISNMFNKKFGKEFLNQKPEALILLEKRLTTYLFDPDSKFLAKFPKLQRKLRHEKKISEKLLKEKIDIGSMVFYDLRGKNVKKTRNINLGKEKILTISKNFTSTPVKDIIGNAFNKIKFWDKNSKRLKNYFKKLGKYKGNIEELAEYENNENEDNNFNKDLARDYNTNREKEINKLNSLKSNSNTNVASNLTLKNHINNNSMVYRNIDKIEPSSLEIKNNDSISFAKRDSFRKRSSINKSIENNIEGDKFITSYISDFRKIDDIIPKISINNNLSRNHANTSNLFYKSNTNTEVNKKNKYNISNIKTKSNLLFTATNFRNKKYMSNTHSKAFSGFKIYTNSKHKYSPRIYLPKYDEILKKKNIKYKANLNNHIVKLNKYTNKCNTELIKLIDGNNDDNYKERKRKIINKTKLDLKEILTGDNKENNKNDMEKMMKEKEKENDTVKVLIERAKFDTGDNYRELDPKKKEKILKKNINHISDEQALDIMEDIVEKQEIDMKEMIGGEDKLKIKKENYMKLIRQKAENNYEKMQKLKNMILIDKRKVFDYPCKQLNSY